MANFAEISMFAGPGVLAPLPAVAIEALESVVVTAETKQASTFQITFRLDTDSPLHTVFLLGQNLSPIPLMRVVVMAKVDGKDSVLIDGVNIAGVAPERRPVNTVFQNYALFPHMTVADNVGFGLRFQECTKDERRRRVGEALELVRLSEFGGRRPHQLSGGQQQRVALARALVLRRALQFELKELHREVGITFVYVTHDQEEALTMSDRLAVMREGTIEQVGPPQEVYDAPNSTYVADFLGLANLLPGLVSTEGEVQVLGRTVPATTGATRGACTVFARPERLVLADPSADAPADAVPGVVDDVVFVGSTTHVRVAVDDQELEVVLSNDGASWVPTPGTRVGVVLPHEALRVLER